MTDARLEVGRIGKPHGLAGEVTAVFISRRPERTEPGATLFAGERELVIETARPHRQGWIIRFAGFSDRDAAESLRGTVLSAPPHADDESTDVASDELWVHDLVGCEVVDRDGRSLGKVAAVEANPAHDLLVLEDGVLVPMPFVVEHHPGRVVVDLPEGLLEL
jgi:16S rRNA processing protein RimM